MGIYTRYNVISMKFLFYLFALLKFCEGSIFVDENCADIITKNGASDESISLYLMPHTDLNHKKRNEGFIEWTNLLGFKNEIISVHPDCSLGYFTALKITDKLIRKYSTSNIINLQVNASLNYLSDYYEGSTKNVVVVGNTDTKYLDNNMEVFKCHKISEEYKMLNCSYEKNDFYEWHLKLTSLLKYKTLYEIIEHVDETNYVNNYIVGLIKKHMGMPIQKHSIIICANNFDSEHETEHNIKFYVIKDCKTVNDFAVHDVLAVIAPKPLESEEMTYLPVIFYDTPYLLPKYDAIYPYSTTLYNYNFDEITKRIVNISLRNNWSRVAMVSDDSLNSDRFEEMMIERFIEHSIVYSVQQCSGLTCDFTKALKWLKEVDARIIVANIDEKYVMQLAYTAAEAGFRAYDKVLWILRDCPLNMKTECTNLGHSESPAKRNVLKKYTALQTLGEMLCFSTSPDAVLSKHKNLQISKALSYVNKIFHKKTPKMKAKILEYNLRKRSKITITEIKNIKEYSKMYERQLLINDINCESFQLQPIKSWAGYSDVNMNCSFRNYNFESPCDDTYLLTILLIILAVLVFVLLFVIFLKKCNPRLRKYRTFN